MTEDTRMTQACDYLFYDSRRAVSAAELQDLFRFTSWGRSRSVDLINKMLDGSSICFSVRCDGRLIAFCRILTDFVFRGTVWDIVVHPDFEGKGVGSRLISYALDHPAVRNVPVIVTYTSELAGFLARYGFEQRDGLLMLQRRPLEYS